MIDPEVPAPSPERVAPRTPRWIGSWIRNCLLVILSLAAACAAIEGAALLWLVLLPPAEHIGRWEFRSSQPAPYKTADYFGDAFLSESMRSLRMGHNTGHFPVPADFEGKFINVVDGRRKTTNQPVQFRNRVLLFGASTVFSQEVPDQDTIASYLQREINSKQPERLLVENCGAASIMAHHQVEMLRCVDLKPGDIVIFYDGHNDVRHAIYKGVPDGWPGAIWEPPVRQLKWPHTFMYATAVEYRRHSAYCSLIMKLYDTLPPVQVADEVTFRGNLEAMEAGYHDALVEANVYARDTGASFFHFLQPNLFSVRAPTEHERQVIRNELLVYPGLDVAFREGYPRLRAAIHAAMAQGVKSFDLSDAFDTREPGQEFFLDECHINHAGNARVAQLIYERVFGTDIRSIGLQ